MGQTIACILHTVPFLDILSISWSAFGFPGEADASCLGAVLKACEGAGRWQEALPTGEP